MRRTTIKQKILNLFRKHKQYTYDCGCGKDYVVYMNFGYGGSCGGGGGCQCGKENVHINS